VPWHAFRTSIDIMLKEELQKGWTDLRQFADEMRLHAHLATLELKSRWQEVEPQVQKLENEVEARGEQAIEASKDAIASLGGTLRKLRDQLQASIDSQTPKPS